MVDIESFHYKSRFGIVRMHVRILEDLDLYLVVVVQKQMKVIDANCNVRMGYWALRINMQKYKVYATMIQIFNLDFLNNLQQPVRDNLWQVELINHNYKI
jgi:hypothetical protein